MTKRKDRIGQKFGSWEVLRLSHITPSPQYRPYWVCRCVCGVERAIEWDSLRRGASKSCGCVAAEVAHKRFLKHGYAQSRRDNRNQRREYESWCQAKNRCYVQTNRSYANYGGRGIRMCDEWRSSFETFLRDMGPRPEGRSLGRINNEGHYEPGNCRWETPKQQAQNRRIRRDSRLLRRNNSLRTT